MVVRGTGEGGGGGVGVEDIIIQGFDHRGRGTRLLPGASQPLNIPSTTRSTGRVERDLKCRGVRSVRVSGGQLGIVCILLVCGQPVKVHCC